MSIWKIYRGQGHSFQCQQRLFIVSFFKEVGNQIFQDLPRTLRVLFWTDVIDGDIIHAEKLNVYSSIKMKEEVQFQPLTDVSHVLPWVPDHWTNKSIVLQNRCFDSTFPTSFIIY